MARVQTYEAASFDRRMLELCAQTAPCLLSEFVATAIHTGIQGANLINALKQLLDVGFIVIDAHARILLTAEGLAALESVHAVSERPPQLLNDRAPQPTMEDILADIHRTIAEETRTEQQRRSARALSGCASCPGKDSAEEEILDLTAELGGLGAEPLPHEVEAAPRPVSEPPVPPLPTQMPQRNLSANEEAASALERAITALRAGQKAIR